SRDRVCVSDAAEMFQPGGTAEWGFMCPACAQFDDWSSNELREVNDSRELRARSNPWPSPCRTKAMKKPGPDNISESGPIWSGTPGSNRRPSPWQGGSG